MASAARLIPEHPIPHRAAASSLNAVAPAEVRQVLNKKHGRPKTAGRPHRSQRLVSAGKSVKSKTQSGDAPPHLNFLEQFTGTLHETIGESDLATLNAGLAFLFAWLRQARQQYDEGDDGGREAAFTALGGLWQFVALFKPSQAELLFTPVTNLMDALAALEKNTVKQILKPVPRRGRAPSNDAYASLQGHAAGTVTRLRTLGLSPEKAHELVAEELAKLRVQSLRGEGIIKKDTVRHWCDVVTSDVSRSGTAAMMYDSMFTDAEMKRFQIMEPAKTRKLAIASLQTYVYEMFPELRTSGKNPVRPPI
jgi:hypothetical protein